MNIQIKNINVYHGLSEETIAFTAVLHIDGKKTGFCKNSGQGEMTLVSPYPGRVGKLAEAGLWVRNQAKVDLGEMEVEDSLDFMIYRMVVEHIRKQEQESPGRKRGRHSRSRRQGDAAANEVSADKSQLIGEVKERNKLYRALTEIQEIAKAASGRQGSVPELDAIGNICRKTLKA